MNKSDYDKYYKKGGTYVIPFEVFNELFDELERLSFNYEEALEDLDKKDNIINELEKDIIEKINDIKKNYSQVNGNYFNMNYVLDTYEDILNKLQELKGSDKE